MNDVEEEVSSYLFPKVADETHYSGSPADYAAHLVEQYRLYVEMADNISERRQGANSYFLTVNTAVLAFVGYVTTNDTSDYLWLLGVAGIALSFLWYRLIRSYRDLNTAKFRVVHQIERRLPARPYDAEWIALGRGKDSKLYKPVTHVEIGVPWVFLALHAFVFLRTVPWSAITSIFS
jgi:hypothetical protein